jgi:molecular chaperone HtpG
LAAAKNSPHLEIFRKKGIEVLLLHDRIDEWLVMHLTEFDKKPLSSIAKGELDLGKLETEEDKAQRETPQEHKALLERIKNALGEKVKDVRLTQRLTTSPACLVSEASDMSANLERILRSVGQDVPAVPPILEINAQHPIIGRILAETEEQRFNDWALLLFDQALLSEGGQLEDPAAFVHRLNELLLQAAQATPAQDTAPKA